MFPLSQTVLTPYFSESAYCSQCLSADKFTSLSSAVRTIVSRQCHIHSISEFSPITRQGSGDFPALSILKASSILFMNKIHFPSIVFAERRQISLPPFL